MCVRLNGVFSNTFGVSNGIRQSGVLFLCILMSYCL